VSFILTAIGTLLFLLCLAGISFGVFMAVDRNTREAGWLFALGWVPAVAAAGGVLMRDAVTFTVGLLCFLIAGTVFILEEENLRRPSVNRRARTPRVGESLGGIPSSFEVETTEEHKPEEDKPEEDKPEEDKPEGDKPEGYGRAVS
jgi:cbb3-type cytochrome oxidase subunit 3